MSKKLKVMEEKRGVGESKGQVKERNRKVKWSRQIFLGK